MECRKSCRWTVSATLCLLCFSNYVAAQGWQAKAEVWEVSEEGLFKDEIRLPANYYFRSARSAHAFVERIAKRGIDRRV